MEIGIYTFGELTSGTPGQRMRDLLEEIELADQVGLDVFGVGEHHRPDFVVSAPAVALAAAARTTEHIRLTSAVSVISSDDPIRIFQDFATLDLISGGRAEIMAGRGSFTESFGLFGYDLKDYDELFANKLAQLLTIRSRDDLGVYPRPQQDPLPVWIAVGGNPQSAARAGMLGLPMALAIIGGYPERFVPFAEMHRRAAQERGHERLPLSINSHGFIAERSQDAVADLVPGLQGDDGPDRPRARLAAADPRAVPRLGRAARRELHRQPGPDRREDPLPARALPARPLPAADERRDAPARRRAARRSSCSGRRSRRRSARRFRPRSGSRRPGRCGCRGARRACGAGWRGARAAPGRRWRTPGPRPRPAARGGSSAARG